MKTTRPRFRKTLAKSLGTFALLLTFPLIVPAATFAEDPTAETAETPEASTSDDGATDDGATDGDAADGRSTFEAAFSVGLIVDTFASEDLKTLLNPDDTGVESEPTASVGAEYRLFGDPSDAEEDQLWFFSSATYGMRSSTVDCDANPDLTPCQMIDDEQAAEEEFVYVLRAATSLEAFLGLRWEFALVNGDSDAPLRLFLEAEAGFLAIEDNGTDLLESRELRLGAMVASGRFAGSRLLVGVGHSDVFHDDPERLLLDGELHWQLTSGTGALFQLTLDSSLDGGNDSIRTFLGVHFDLATLFAASGD